MNLFQIISEIEKADPEIMDRLTHRRSALTALGDLSKKFALAAAPIAIGAAFNKAAGQNTLNNVGEVLNYALLLEYLEEDFYAQALAAPTLALNLAAGSAARGAIQTIKNHETAHVNLLKTALGAAARPRPASGFDFGTAFSTYASFLAFAQAFEDTGVRAYKGQASRILAAGNSSSVLQTALQIHSVEARHASHVRYMRRAPAAGGTMQFGWITNGEANGAPDMVYGAGNPVATFPAEGNTMQAGLTLTSIGGNTYTAAEVSEAFDEGLDNTTVLNIARSAATFTL